MFCVDKVAVLHDIARVGGEVDEGSGVDCFETSDLVLEGGLVAPGCVKDLLPRYGVGLVDSVVGAVGGCVVSRQAERYAAAQVGQCDAA